MSNQTELPRYSNLKNTADAKAAILEIANAAMVAMVEVNQVLLAHHTSLDQTSLEAAIAGLVAEGALVVRDAAANTRTYQLA